MFLILRLRRNDALQCRKGFFDFDHIIIERRFFHLLFLDYGIKISNADVVTKILFLMRFSNSV